MKDALSKIPIIRLLLPFVIGIIIASSFEIQLSHAVIFCIISCIIFIGLTIIKSPLIKLTKSYYLNTPLIIVCISLGCICFNLNRPKVLPEINYNHSVANATIIKIQDKDFSTNMHLRITSVTDSCGNKYRLNHKMTAWLEHNDYSLKEGSIISFKFNQQRIQNNGNPEEFDYQKHMQHKGFLYHVFIRQNEYITIGQQNDLHTFFRHIQRDLINKLLCSKLKPETKTFFTTILLGDSSYLSNDIRENLSHAGIAHILALSGLHVGIIAFLLSILLMPLDYIYNKRVRLIITLLISIFFVFLTGLSHSAVRATIMFGFIIISKILYRKNTSLNALFFAALVILVITPSAIYDIGFQFSFISVLLILLVSSKINIISPKNELLYYAVSLITISFTTFLGTMIFTAYYFNFISFVSVFSNIILIPIIPFIVGCGCIYIILLSLGIELQFFTELSDIFYSFIINFANDINKYPNSFYENIYISTISLWLYILAIAFIIIFIYKRKAFNFYSSLCFIIGGITIQLFEISKLPELGYVIFNDPAYTPILCIKNDSAQIIVNDSTFDINEFRHKHRRFIAKHHLSHIEKKIIHNKNIILGKEKVTIVKDNSIKRLTATNKINTDILLISKGFYGNIEDLIKIYNTQLIVISGNIHYELQNKFAQQCKEIGVKSHVLSKQGAIYKYFNTQ